MLLKEIRFCSIESLAKPSCFNCDDWVKCLFLVDRVWLYVFWSLHKKIQLCITNTQWMVLHNTIVIWATTWFSSFFFSGTILIFKGGVLCFILYSFFRASHLILYSLHLKVTLLVECWMEIEYNCGKGFSEPYPRERAKQKPMMNKPS